MSSLRRLQLIIYPSLIHRLNYLCLDRRISCSQRAAPFHSSASFQLANDSGVGAEIAGPLDRRDVQDILMKFAKRDQVLLLAEDHGLDRTLFDEACLRFRQSCLGVGALSADLHILLADIISGAPNRSVDDLFPHFLQVARQAFPHLECMKELQQISDLSIPHNWYPEARQKVRKVIFHAGPTNSGKTFHALQQFLAAKSGVYCGPLKLLASEVYHKSNKAGVPCDLITGEERKYVREDGSFASHVACTIEMLNTKTHYDVAVIDEVQMLRDQTRGWAWTRAVLGAFADEIHLCGEESTINLVKDLLYNCAEDVDVRHYERKTPLRVENGALKTLDDVSDGDCIVTFSKNDIYSTSRYLESKGRSVAVIYGGLPPGTKLAQANNFNDPTHPCKILVATDAIGMGLNLHIRRVIFYSLTKPTLKDSGEVAVELLSTSQAKQIAGRAGRFGTKFSEGLVTCLKESDIAKLHNILDAPVDSPSQAGLFPTSDQIELFSFHLPKSGLKQLLDIFVSLSKMDSSLYFLCNIDDTKFLAEQIESIVMPLNKKYTFCLAPINRKNPFAVSLFQKFARRFASGNPLTLNWLCQIIGWPYKAPRTVADLTHLEGVFDVMDLYLWLGYRFPDMFPDMELVRQSQVELDLTIQEGVSNITNLLKTQDKPLFVDNGGEKPADQSTATVKKNKKSRVKEVSAAVRERSVDVSSQHIKVSANQPPVATTTFGRLGRFDKNNADQQQSRITHANETTRLTSSLTEATLPTMLSRIKRKLTR